MVTLVTATQNIFDQKVDCFGLLVSEKGLSAADAKACEKMFDIVLPDYLKKHDFTGASLQTFALPILKDKTLYHIIVVGLGVQKKITIEAYRRALAHLYRQAAAHKAKKASFSLPPVSLFKLSPEEFGQQTATTLGITEKSLIISPN